MGVDSSFKVGPRYIRDYGDLEQLHAIRVAVPAYQGKGLPSLLIERVRRKARELGCTILSHRFDPVDTGSTKANVRRRILFRCSRSTAGHKEMMVCRKTLGSGP